MSIDTASFIRANLHIEHARMLPEIRVYTAHPGSRIGRLEGSHSGNALVPPYWAYGWAGGTVLARHILDHPEIVRGRRVVDLGSGSGVVGIAARMAGALSVLASDVDPRALVATRLNAELNGVELDTVEGDLTDQAPPRVDIVLVGDLFYDARTAAKVLQFLTACVAAGIVVLIGDPYRAHLPEDRLSLVAAYEVPDFGSGTGGRAAVFALS